MLHRFFAILLTFSIPIQGLAMSHSHGVAGETQPEGHNQTPHFHFGAGHHHDHDVHSSSDDSQQEAKPTSSDSHDDDAIYTSGDLGLASAKTAWLLSDFEITLNSSIHHSATAVQGHSLLTTVARPPDSGGVATFLKTLSLRL